MAAPRNVDSLKQFQGAVAAFSRKIVPAQAALFQRRLTLEALRRIVQRTPVDTGRARGNWQTTVGAMAEGTVATVDPSGRAALAKGINATEGMPPFGTTWITNNLPYAERLENGWSQQAPAGMVGLTIADITAGIASAAGITLTPGAGA